jgi:hypothetical protein
MVSTRALDKVELALGPAQVSRENVGRNGLEVLERWYATMDRPRRAHSSRIRSGDHADAMRSFSNSSML